MRDPLADLRRIAFLLERAGEKTYRVRAFRGAAAALAKLPEGELAARAAAGTLKDLQGVGEVTARCVVESLAGEEPVYLRRLESTAGQDLDEATAAMLAALRGDCHAHSDWSDGGSPIDEMALAAAAIGHEYLVLTDHSPRLTVARGLSAERLTEQLDVVADLNAGFAGLGMSFRILTGIEVDILADGSLDQTDALLERLDVVVGSVHSNLKDEPDVMTRRMVTALANPHLDAEAAAAGGPGGGLPVLDRHRRARPRAARLAVKRLRARRRLRGPAGPDRQHAPRRGPPGVDDDAQIAPARCRRRTGR
jgi:putative hydrolase